MKPDTAHVTAAPGASSSRQARYELPMYPPETPVEKLPAMLTSGQAAHWLDVSRKTLANLCRRGELTRLPSVNRRFVLFERDQVAGVRRRDVRFMQPAS